MRIQNAVVREIGTKIFSFFWADIFSFKVLEERSLFEKQI